MLRAPPYCDLCGEYADADELIQIEDGEVLAGEWVCGNCLAALPELAAADDELYRAEAPYVGPASAYAAVMTPIVVVLNAIRDSDGLTHTKRRKWGRDIVADRLRPQLGYALVRAMEGAVDHAVRQQLYQSGILKSSA